MTVELPGGGGYGPPAGRDPERVLEDVREGYVSLERAREEYGVAIDPVTGTRAGGRDREAPRRDGAGLKPPVSARPAARPRRATRSSCRSDTT